MGSIEAVVLTGGESRRMGFDKASIAIDGVPQADRIVRQFLAAGLPVTVLGRQPINGAAFLPDEEMFGGPIAALTRFVPSAEFVFVSSCDLRVCHIKKMPALLQTQILMSSFIQNQLL